MNSKRTNYTLFFLVPFHSSKLVYFFWKLILGKFSPRKISISFLKTIERDNLINLIKLPWKTELTLNFYKKKKNYITNSLSHVIVFTIEGAL